MIVHMRTHTGEKSCECELCDYRSARRGGMIAYKYTLVENLSNASYVVTVLPRNRI